MEISTMAEQADAEFKLRDLNDQELTEQVHDDLYNGLKAEVEEATRIFLERGWNAEKVLNDALVEGMRIVGIDVRYGILFVPEVLLAANSMKGGMEMLRPLLAETGVPPIGKIVIGTVKGDIHDIGKNLVSMMLEGAGFEVIDLGINNPVEKYLAALEEHKPDILGMSALLTTTMPYMKVVIDTMKDKGIRNDYIVLVGGAPLNEEFGKAVGADAYCRDAAIAVETAKGLLAARRAARAEAELGTFSLTAFLLRHSGGLVVRLLGLDRHPQLAAEYFRHYKKLVYLAQTDRADAIGRARQIADSLGFWFEYRYTGYGELGTRLRTLVSSQDALAWQA